MLRKTGESQTQIQTQPITERLEKLKTGEVPRLPEFILGEPGSDRSGRVNLGPARMRSFPDSQRSTSSHEINEEKEKLREYRVTEKLLSLDPFTLHNIEDAINRLKPNEKLTVNLEFEDESAFASILSELSANSITITPDNENASSYVINAGSNVEKIKAAFKEVLKKAREKVSSMQRKIEEYTEEGFQRRIALIKDMYNAEPGNKDFYGRVLEELGEIFSKMEEEQKFPFIESVQRLLREGKIRVPKDPVLEKYVRNFFVDLTETPRLIEDQGILYLTDSVQDMSSYALFIQAKKLWQGNYVEKAGDLKKQHGDATKQLELVKPEQADLVAYLKKLPEDEASLVKEALSELAEKGSISLSEEQKRINVCTFLIDQLSKIFSSPKLEKVQYNNFIVCSSELGQVHAYPGCVDHEESLKKFAKDILQELSRSNKGFFSRFLPQSLTRRK